MQFAPVLQDVAARIAGAGNDGDDPVRQGYRLRDAIELVRPDWVVSHHDPVAETAAVRAAGADVDPIDVALAEQAPVASYVELVGVLAKLYPDRVVAASVTGPASMAATLADAGAEADVLDCGDLLAELVATYVGAGATRVVVWESEVSADAAAEVSGAHTSIVRRLSMLAVPGVLCGGSDVDSAGYAAHALPDGGRDAVLLPAGTFAAGSAQFGQLWQRWSAAGDERPELILTDGPMPADCDLELLSSVVARRSDRPG